MYNFIVHVHCLYINGLLGYLYCVYGSMHKLGLNIWTEKHPKQTVHLCYLESQWVIMGVVYTTVAGFVSGKLSLVLQYGVDTDPDADIEINATPSSASASASRNA